LLDDTTYRNMERIFRVGVPAKCHAHSTEDNIHGFLRHGNHKSADDNPDATRKSILKDFRPGFLLTFDQRLRWHIPNFHICPISMQNVGHPTKSQHPAFDALFHPTPNSVTINDWTNKQDEPAMTFSTAKTTNKCWLWWLRGTYPTHEIYPQDDDVQGAHRWGIYHPNMVAMHGFRYDTLLHFYSRIM
jgi:hypothetical protein